MIRSTYPGAKAQQAGIREAAAACGVEVAIVTVREAKDQLSRRLDRAGQGANVVMASDGRPKAMTVRYRPHLTGKGWTAHGDLREKTLVVEDSAPLLRAERDRGY